MKTIDSLRNRYGSLAGAARLCRSSIALRAGVYDRYRKIDWESVTRLVFVCNGNICRSVIGEYKATSLGLSAISYGIDCPDGDPPNTRAIQAAGSIGLDLRGHSTCNFSNYQVRTNDLVLFMTSAQLERVEGFDFGGAQHSLLSLWNPRPFAYLHDPYNASDEFFEYSARQIVRCVENIATLLRGE